MIYLSGIPDSRQEWKVAHELKDIVVITLFATLANADDWVEIGIFGKSNEKLLKRYIGLKNGVPSHDTIQRVMSNRARVAPQRCPILSMSKARIV